MSEPILDLGGVIILPESLVTERAKATATVLVRNGLEYARLVGCRQRTDGAEEILLLELDVQRPQRRAHDIDATEPVAIIFYKDDRRPEVVSLRADFPQVPHLNLSPTELPQKPLPIRKIGASWEIAVDAHPIHPERIRFWFSETARWKLLHKEDQPLEPLIVGSGYEIIVPYDLFTKLDDVAVQPLLVRLSEDDVNSKVLLATSASWSF